MTDHIRIATRQSPLALWQAHYVRDALLQTHPGLQVSLLTMTTKGDRILDAPLAKVGGKGLFVKELEQAMLEGRADIAVHSMKDVPVAFPEGLVLPVICEREDPADAFVSNRYSDFAGLPTGARVGTSSFRRQCQLRHVRPDLQILDLRGNVGTRLSKLDAGEYDAIILAAAGLLRLGMADRIRERLSYALSLPAVGQGAVGVECRADDPAVLALLQPLHHPATAQRVAAERAVNQRLQGGCQVPVAAFAELEGDAMWLRARVGNLDGSQLIHREVRGPAAHGEHLGTGLADTLLADGAAPILEALRES